MRDCPPARAALLPTVLLLCLWLLPGCQPARLVINLAPGGDGLQRTTVIDDGKLFSDRVALIDVSGLMLSNNRRGLLSEGENPVALLDEQLNHAAGDANVKAVVLRINTAGGTVTASDAMYRQVQRFRRRTDKPVVVCMMDMATSGGYYLACASDRIIAYPTSITGSIGVIIRTFSLEPAMARLGVRSQSITSGKNKDTGSLFKNLTKEQRAILQGLVDDFYARFVNVVREHRPRIPEDEFDRITDGRVFSGAQALELGLVDATGDIHDAFAAARELAGIKHADLVRYHRPIEHVASPYASASEAPAKTSTSAHASGTTQINLLQMNIRNVAGLDAPVGVYYLWQPGMGGAASR